MSVLEQFSSRIYIRGKGNSCVEQPIRELYFSIYTPAKLLYCSSKLLLKIQFQIQAIYTDHVSESSWWSAPVNAHAYKNLLLLGADRKGGLAICI
jgi:hypothetical protein